MQLRYRSYRYRYRYQYTSISTYPDIEETSIITFCTSISTYPDIEKTSISTFQLRYRGGSISTILRYRRSKTYTDIDVLRFDIDVLIDSSGPGSCTGRAADRDCTGSCIYLLVNDCSEGVFTPREGRAAARAACIGPGGRTAPAQAGPGAGAPAGAAGSPPVVAAAPADASAALHHEVLSIGRHTRRRRRHRNQDSQHIPRVVKPTLRADARDLASRRVSRMRMLA